MIRTESPNREIVKSIVFVTLLLALMVVAASGCRTAASLGLPISAGGNAMLSDVVKIRQSVGHRDDVANELAKATLPAPRVEAGDSLVIEPNDFNSPVRLPGDQTVASDGTIELGQYGKLAVAGLTPTEIQIQVQQAVMTTETARRDRLAAASKKSDMTLASATMSGGFAAGGFAAGGPAAELDDADYGVSVRLVNQEGSLVYVMGEVNAPGSYPLVGHETVLDALIAAGGLSDRANDHKIILTRPQTSDRPRVILPVCYHQIVQLGIVETNYQIMPGDRIYVPAISLMEDLRQSMPGGLGISCPDCKRHK